MNYYEVSPNGVVGKDFKVLTYSASDDLLNSLPSTYHPKGLIGAMVEIPVGKRKFVGVVINKVSKPKFECKQISRALTDLPLPPQLIALHQWLAAYYATHPGTVWQTMLPAGLAKKRRAQNPEIIGKNDQSRTNILFTDDQGKAISKLLKMSSGTAILHGITGSGKTEVYKALAMESATRDKSSIILVPEISLTAQLVSEFRRDFSNVIVTHSTMTEAERHLAWLAALNASEPTVVIGPRSALFMPLRDLGLIVIDECHEPSYKQEKSPRYNTLRAASKLAEFTNQSSLRAQRSNPGNCRLILGSATPLIADYYTAKQLNRPIVEMKQLARREAIKPKITVVDLTRRDAKSKNPIFSRQLLDAIEKSLTDKRQVMLFHNRRGTAPLTLCENCGWSAMCPRCFVPLTLHVDKHQLRCHICGHHESPPTICPSCANANIIHRGIGTKRIEEEIRKLFPDARIQRFDGDSVRGEAVHDLFDDLKIGNIDIIIGTQTIAKGLDLPNLALVGIVQADTGLMLPDFSSSERTFQLIAQATGRVGRDKSATDVIIQTYQPNHPAVIYGADQDYTSFYNYEIKNRQSGHFPPFSHLLKLTNSYKTEKAAINSAKKLASVIPHHFSAKSSVGSSIRILGPSPCFYERQRDNYRWQIIIRATNRADLIKITSSIPLQKWSVELDPNSLI